MAKNKMYKFVGVQAGQKWQASGTKPLLLSPVTVGHTDIMEEYLSYLNIWKEPWGHPVVSTHSWRSGSGSRTGLLAMLAIFCAVLCVSCFTSSIHVSPWDRINQCTDILLKVTHIGTYVYFCHSCSHTQTNKRTNSRADCSALQKYSTATWHG